MGCSACKTIRLSDNNPSVFNKEIKTESLSTRQQEDERKDRGSLLNRESRGGSERTAATRKRSPLHFSLFSPPSCVPPDVPDTASPSEVVPLSNGDEKRFTPPSAVRVGQRKSIQMSRLKKHANIADYYDFSTNILGTGISGAVRVVSNKTSGQKFAVKTLSLEGTTTKKAAMLHNEVCIYLQLDHPNIAKLIEVYEEENAIHLVMELCTGKELYDRLASRKKYSESDAVVVTRQMLEAINYCHKHLICHRDLKLENWVYATPDENSDLKLIDFGFSRIFNPGIPMTAMHGTVYYVSPEVMDGCYREKCDIWSIGVIVYMLLSGSPPFNGTFDHEILIKIKRGAFSFNGSRWAGISKGAKDFISHLLIRHPDERPSAEKALKHPWLNPECATPIEIELDVIEQMQQFSVCNTMKRAALGMIALSMGSNEVADLAEQFRALDVSNSGTILLQDIASILVERLNISESEAQRIFERLDQSGDHEVHYSEFLAATIQMKILKNERILRDAFQKFDVDHNGLITVEDLRQVVGDSYKGTKVEDIVKSCDRSGDGVIDYQEFLATVLGEDPSIIDEDLRSIDVSSPSPTAAIEG